MYIKPLMMNRSVGDIDSVILLPFAMALINPEYEWVFYTIYEKIADIVDSESLQFMFSQLINST